MQKKKKKEENNIPKELSFAARHKSVENVAKKIKYDFAGSKMFLRN